jgi:type IX secretion system PorP/SprF family membrane protein
MRNIFLFILCLITSLGFCQDPQFSQYYSAPLFLNPAMTGATDCYRVGVNARSQWTGLPGAFNTAAVYADMNYSDLRSGFGVMALHDEIGTPKLTSNEFSGFYSYEVPVTSQFNVRFGLEGTYVNRNIGYSKLIFEDQYSGTNVVNSATSDPVAGFNKTQYMDFAAGMVLFGEKKYWLGLATHHLNQPRQAFYTTQSRLPIEYSVHGGYNFYIKKGLRSKEEDWFKITPNFLYKWQTKFDQVDIGAYFVKVPVTFGLSYRGIFFKDDFNIRNSDALIFLLGLQHNSFSFTYSYDYTTSALYQSNSHGSHEISLVYLFCLDWPRKRKPPRNVRRLPCPDFQRSTK